MPHQVRDNECCRFTDVTGTPTQNESQLCGMTHIQVYTRSEKSELYRPLLTVFGPQGFIAPFSSGITMEVSILPPWYSYEVKRNIHDTTHHIVPVFHSGIWGEIQPRRLRICARKLSLATGQYACAQTQVRAKTSL